MSYLEDVISSASSYTYTAHGISSWNIIAMSFCTGKGAKFAAEISYKIYPLAQSRHAKGKGDFNQRSIAAFVSFEYSPS